MIQVLIVDDEPKLREGLRSFIDWEAHGYCVADTASNGHEALEKYEQLRPGLVVADIRMPGMDGLQLIGHLRKKDPSLHILILSGYADFEYAKKAIQQRADGYLLKPVDEDELIHYLGTIKAQIDEESQAEQWRLTTREWGRESFIISLMLEQPGAPEQLWSRAEELGLAWKSYQVLLLSTVLDEADYEDKLAAVRNEMTRLLEAKGRGYVFSHHSQIGVLLKDPILPVEWNELYSNIRNIVEVLDIDFSLALGPKVCRIGEVAYSYGVANRLNKNHFFLGNDRLLTEELLVEQKHDTEVSVHELDEQIFYAVEIGNHELVKQLIEQKGACYISQGLTEEQIKLHFAEMLTALLGRGIKQSPELQQRNREFSEYLSDIYKAWTLGEVYEKAEQFLKKMMSELGANESSKHQEVKMMLELIHRNYNENLKLETLSGILNYNSAYLGKLFKNETGEYFNTYLDKVRIEKAKGLLEEGLKVYQVAERVGYTNVDYFHSKFRKYVGTSPSAYRKTSNH